MYGQNLSVRPDAPGELIFTKFCKRVRVPDLFLSFEFQKHRKKNVGAVGVEISLLPLKRHIAYTTACCYCTSRDGKDDSQNFSKILSMNKQMYGQLQYQYLQWPQHILCLHALLTS